MLRTKTLASVLFLIVVPSLLIYYFYYDSITGQISSLQRYGNSALVKHKYSPLYAERNVNRTNLRRLPLSVARLLSEEETKDPDPEIERRRQFVKTMMKEAWNSYVQYAWGHNELKPLTKEPKTDTIFGAAKNGLTIVDSLDTLLIMDLKEEFEQGRKWVAEELHFEETNNEVSIFETVIRYVGGLLSCYALTGDQMFLNKSKEVAEALLPAYNTETGLPNGLIVPKTGKNYHHSWAYGSILSEMGSQHLEYIYLSDMTGDVRFRDRVLHIRNYLNKMEKPHGLYMNMVDNVYGRWTENKSTLGALSDSFYEYLIKAYIQSNHKDHVALKMYKDAVDAIDVSGIINISPTGLVYLSDLFYGKANNKMQHLTCFAGGMYALGAHELAKDNSVVYSDATAQQVNRSIEYDRINRHFALGINVTNTCHESYVRAPTGLGPETFYFDNDNEATNKNGDMYILRPEVIESYFVLWRLTNDTRYRDYAWEATEAIYKYCRTDAGYSGLHNVMKVNSSKDNQQQSFFTAETLKYLYLIFSNDKLLPLDQWVFNTEAHPLPICGNNPAYPMELCNTHFE